jgi:hypothetical protein
MALIGNVACDQSSFFGISPKMISMSEAYESDIRRIRIEFNEIPCIFPAGREFPGARVGRLRQIPP